MSYAVSGEIKEIYDRLGRTFKSGKTRSLQWRRHQLLQLARMLQENIRVFEDALVTDLGKPRLETTLMEIAPVIQACVKAVDLLEEWTKPEKPEVHEFRSSWDVTIYKEPKGVSLLISPWNYPYVITLLPFVGTIAAGCPAVLKPSELSPNSSAVMATLMAKYLDPDAYVVIQGGADVATELLSLKWGHIFFTGSVTIGRIVATAASKHITPLTLELGGKCPVIIDSNCDIDLAAKRTLFGKVQTAGQVCVTPDYALVHRAVRPAFESQLKKYYKEFFPDGPFAPNIEYSKIVNEPHFDRLKDLLKRTKGEIIFGGETKGDKIAPTVVTNVKPDDALMEEEIFGPILALIEIENVDEAIDFVTSRPTPLVVYAFTKSEEIAEKLVTSTQSGSLVLNDTFMQLSVAEAPFGGQGESGYGAYFTKDSFDAFTHRRTFINVPPSMEPSLALRYQPYTEDAYKIMTAGAHIEIPAA